MPTKRRWKMSVAWIVWVTMWSAWDHFHSGLPLWTAARLWYLVPWAGFLAYLFGRMDARYEHDNAELDPMQKELYEWLVTTKGAEVRELMRTRTRLIFKGKN